MTPNKIFFFLFSLVLCIFPHANAAVSLVGKVCERTHSKANCIASLASNRDSKTANIEQLGLIALKLAAENATHTTLHIKQLLNNRSTWDPTTEQALSDCYDQYVDANTQLADAGAALLVKDNRNVYVWVSAAIANAKTCEDGFKQNSVAGKDSILTQKNAIFRQLCNNVLAIVKFMNNKKH
ncbi:pectinesterase inhibitor 28-like [Mercurialis annua]|uniref:pectinesterase inhibitor 28-like n=1 Tax=Mercurialis annua TaxID=3986 RepID=UPI00215F9143|nr:pectinesterase inhibitor 28-like [Mercurialis annua]